MQEIEEVPFEAGPLTEKSELNTERPPRLTDDIARHDSGDQAKRAHNAALLQRIPELNGLAVGSEADVRGFRLQQRSVACDIDSCGSIRDLRGEVERDSPIHMSSGAE